MGYETESTVFSGAYETASGQIGGGAGVAPLADITVPANQTEVVIPALDGAANGRVQLQASLRLATGAAKVLSFRPNNYGGTDLKSRLSSNNGSLGGVSSSWNFTGSISAALAAPTSLMTGELPFTVQALIDVGVDQDGNYQTPMISVDSVVHYSGSLSTYGMRGHWAQSIADPVTSIVLASSAASGILAGSRIIVYPLPAPLT